jgi:hypothetical protein
MNRTRLRNRRACETFEFDCAGLRYVASVGFTPDRSVGEVFLDAGKAGTHLSVATKEAAIIASLALQHGCPIETLRSACLRAANGKAEGAVGQLLDMIASR